MTSVKLLVFQLCPRLFATPWTVAPPGSSVHGIVQAGILEWVAIPYLPNPGVESGSPVLQANSLPSEPSGKLLIFIWQGQENRALTLFCQ